MPSDVRVRQRHPIRRWRYTAVAVIGVLLAFEGRAQTLPVALDQAWSRHPQAVTFVARAAEANARADLAASWTPTPPALSLSNVSDRLNADTGKNAWELELAVPLWLPGQRAAHAGAASHAVSDVQSRQVALRLQLAGELREAWWSLSGARLAVDVAQRRDSAARVMESDVLRRFKAGELARIDANLAQNERFAAESELLEAQSALLHAEQAYRLLTGADAPLSLAEEQVATVSILDAVHPQLAAAQAAEQLAQARLGVADKTRRDAPELALSIARDRGDFNTPYANAVGVKLTIPFSSESRVRQERSTALVDVAQAQAELAQVRQRIELEEARARQGVALAQLQLLKAQERLSLTSDSLRLAEKSFALGESDLAALLRVRLSAFEAEAAVNRQRLACSLGLSRLNQSLGVLP
jgi:cobalt-zinc-cadmium efflux system outer membrane protein